MVAPLIIIIAVLLFVPPATTLASDGLNAADSPIGHAVVKIGEKQLEFFGLKSQKSIVLARLREAEIVKNNPRALRQTLDEAQAEIDKIKDEITLVNVSRHNVEVLTALRDKLPEAVTNNSRFKCPLGSVGYGIKILKGCA